MEGFASLREEFPLISQLPDGRTALLNRERTQTIPLTNAEVEAIGEIDPYFKRFQHYAKGGKYDIYEMVKKEGLEKEHCLIFAGKVLFHSKSKEEVDRYETQNNLDFIRWGPIY
jgi:hypothetical protein